MKRFYVYTRVSSQGQSENTSQHVQLAACKAYGEENSMIFVDWIHDTQSGIEWGKRKGIQELKAVAESGEITDVIFYKIDRTGRDGEVKELIKFLYRNKVRVSIAHKSKTYDTEHSCIKDNFWEIAVSEYELTTIVERTMSGKLYQFESGGIINKPIAGYDISKDKREINGKVSKIATAIIIPSKAEAVRYLFQVFNETQSESATVRAVNFKYPDVLQKKAVLRRNMRKNILSKALVYAGLPVTESFNGHTREFKYPPIIDIETASKTMAYLSAYSRKRNDNVTPFSGIIKCKCGKGGKATAVVARGNGESSYGFQCATNKTHKHLRTMGASSEQPKCKHNVRITYIINAIDSFFEQTDEQSFLTKYETALTKQVEQYNTRVSDLDRLKEHRIETEQKKAKIMDTILTLSTNPDFAAMIKGFGPQVVELDKELSKVTESIRKVSDSVSASRLVLDTLGINAAHFSRPLATKESDGTVSIEYNGETHSFKNMHEYSKSDIRKAMQSDLFDSRLFDTMDGLNKRISDIREWIKAADWEKVNPALKELGIWVTVPFAVADTHKRRDGVSVTVDFAPLKAELTKSSRGVGKR